MNPTHQRGLMLHMDGAADGYLDDMMLWVRIGAPQVGSFRGATKSGPQHGAVYDTAVMTRDGMMVVRADSVELLARGPEDFAVNPPEIQFADWVNSERARLEKERRAAA